MIFILGIERSATTWVANILDHHTRTDVYMEPLSQFNSRFNRWPNRFTQLKHFGQRATYFLEEFEILQEHRRFFLTQLSETSFAWQTDLKLVQFLVQKQIATNTTKDFLELNFHRKNRQISVSKQPPLNTVIKELRLNFNAALIPVLDEQAQVLVVIREPASTIRSILEQIEQGNLVELASDLNRYYGEISLQTICTYWYESYSTLIETLENESTSYRMVSHIDLLKDREEAVDQIFDYVGLPLTSEVKRYLQLSNQSGSGKHSTERSVDELLVQMENDRKAIYPRVKNEMKKIQHHPVLKKFVGKI